MALDVRTVATIAVVTLGGIAVAQRVPATRDFLVPPRPSPAQEYGAAIGGYTDTLLSRLRAIFLKR